MVTILAHGVADSSRSGYSARPGTSGHRAYGIGHIRCRLRCGNDPPRRHGTTPAGGERTRPTYGRPRRE
ncbi:hypothetical protein E7X38_19975 [Streptomyces sp. Akac8]|nr:hypothetical protein E7X38_19975 [Streptomyces sp. Akac8]